ncbi:MAG: YceH family protein [Bacteroidetes bacterium]|nr:YceH family protein [Bacteroidota bacterium]
MEKNLSPEAVRVLGVLIEKELSTPEYYPMTLNALANGCNQKSNRHPVVEYGEFQIRENLDELGRHRLVGHAAVAGSRTEKFRHAAAQHWNLGREQLAILASLMLRGPQTVGELRTHTARMATFDTMEQVAAHLDVLASVEEPLVVSVGRLPGQKGERFGHLLEGQDALEAYTAAASEGLASGGGSGFGDSAKMHLNEELENIRSRLSELEEKFEAFRRQFE